MYDFWAWALKTKFRFRLFQEDDFILSKAKDRGEWSTLI